MNEDGKYTVVWKSNKVDNNLSPVFQVAKISMSSLCNGDVHRPLQIEIFDWDSNGKHETMGVVSLCVFVLLCIPSQMVLLCYVAKFSLPLPSTHYLNRWRRL